MAATNLARKRARYLALTRARQREWAVFIWVVHVLALFLFILLVAAYL